MAHFMDLHSNRVGCGDHANRFKDIELSMAGVGIVSLIMRPQHRNGNSVGVLSALLDWYFHAACLVVARFVQT